MPIFSLILIRRDITEISNLVSWGRRQNFPPKVGKSTSGFAKSHTRRYNAGTLKMTVIYASQFLCKRIRDYTTWTPGPWRWMQQIPPKVGEFLSKYTISHSGRQNSSISPARRPQTSHTAINFAAERGDFWPKCSSGSHMGEKTSWEATRKENHEKPREKKIMRSHAKKKTWEATLKNHEKPREKKIMRSHAKKKSWEVRRKKIMRSRAKRKKNHEKPRGKKKIMRSHAERKKIMRSHAKRKSREEWNNVTFISGQETLYNSNEVKRYLCKCSAGYMLLIPQSLNPRSYVYQKSTPARSFRPVKLLRTVLLWNYSEMTRYFPFFPAGWLVNSSETVDLNGAICDQWQVENTAQCCCQSWRLASESLAKAYSFIHSILRPSLGARDN